MKYFNERVLKYFKISIIHTSIFINIFIIQYRYYDGICKYLLHLSLFYVISMSLIVVSVCINLMGGGGKFFTGLYANLTRRFLHPEIQDGGRIAEVVIIWRRKTIST